MIAGFYTNTYKSLQRYDSFFNVQIFLQNFLARDRETCLLNSILVPIFCPKKALKKGDRLAKQQTCLYFLPQKKTPKKETCLLFSKHISVFLYLYSHKKIACKLLAGYFDLKEGRCFFNNLFVNFP